MGAIANSSLLPFQVRANMPTPLTIVKELPDTTGTFQKDVNYMKPVIP